MLKINLLISKRNKFASGFVLTEILIAIGLLAFLSLISAMVFNYVTSLSLNTILTNTRSSLMSSFREKVGSVKVLRTTLVNPANVAFAHCVCGSAAGCTSGLVTPLALYEPGDLLTKTNYQYFDAYGMPCLSPTATNCLIRVSTQFIAQCLPVLPSANPMPPANCNTPAEFVAVTFILEKNPSSLQNGILFKARQSTAYTQTSVIGVAGDGICP
jgi:hypothetical protein